MEWIKTCFCRPRRSPSRYRREARDLASGLCATHLYDVFGRKWPPQVAQDLAHDCTRNSNCKKQMHWATIRPKDSKVLAKKGFSASTSKDRTHLRTRIAARIAEQLLCVCRAERFQPGAHKQARASCRNTPAHWLPDPPHRRFRSMAASKQKPSAF